MTEATLRRRASALGLKLEKSRTRDSRLPEWGTYRLVSRAAGFVVARASWSAYGLSLDQLADELEDIELDRWEDSIGWVNPRGDA